MHLKAESLDDLLRRLLPKLISTKKGLVRSSRGANYERIGVILTLTNPRSRLSRSFRRSQLFSALGETAWYLKGSDSLKFITYYIQRYKSEAPSGSSSVPAAYGPRLRRSDDIDQLGNVIELLRTNSGTRRAAIQILKASDIGTPYVPCTCTLQFLVRSRKLHMMTHMRSNDAYIGLPHDVFSFTMIQEIVARELNLELGEYKHSVASMHIYEGDIGAAETYIADGFQQSLSMPAMPLGSQTEQIREFLKIESSIRRKVRTDLDRTTLNSYWLDLARLLRIYRFAKDHDIRGMNRQREKISSRFYDQYIDTRQRQVVNLFAENPQQHNLFVATDRSNENKTGE